MQYTNAFVLSLVCFVICGGELLVLLRTLMVDAVIRLPMLHSHRQYPQASNTGIKLENEIVRNFNIKRG